MLDEIENDTDRAIDAAVDDLPSGFPERIVSSFIEACAGVSACSPMPRQWQVAAMIEKLKWG
jgi:hypothetical protein